MNIASNVFTAIGTVAMATTTAYVIWQNKRYHRDEYKPVCVLMPYSGVDPLLRATLLNSALLQDGEAQLRLNCILKNIGVSPALDVRLRIRLLDMQGFTTKYHELSPLASGERLGGERDPILVAIQLDDTFSTTDFASVEDKPWEVWLEYKDVFGAVFHTRHAKFPQDPWTVLGEGPIPPAPPPQPML